MEGEMQEPLPAVRTAGDLPSWTLDFSFLPSPALFSSVILKEVELCGQVEKVADEAVQGLGEGELM